MHMQLLSLFLFAVSFAGTEMPEKKERTNIISVGEKADPFSLEDINGNVVDLEKYLGSKFILLNFFTTWCGRCNWESKGINNVYSDYKGKVFFVRINLMEEKKKVVEFAKKYEIPFPVLVDEAGAVSKLYGVKYVPANIIVDQQGIVRFTGGLLSEDDLRQRLNEVLSK